VHRVSWLSFGGRLHAGAAAATAAAAAAAASGI